jgi:type IV secretory pathway VirB6-like protein
MVKLPEKIFPLLTLFCVFFLLSACTTPPDKIKERHDGGGGTVMVPKGNCPDGRDCRVCIETNQIFVVPPSAASLKVSAPPPSGGAAVGPVTYVLKVVKDRLQASTQAIVTAIVNDPEYKRTVVALLTLLTAIYFFLVLTGGASPHIADMLTVLIKVIIVYFLVSDYATITMWTRDLGETIVSDLSAIFISNLSTFGTVTAAQAELSVTGSMDRFINMFLSMEFFEFLLAIALNGAVGFSFFFMILVMFFFYIAAVLKVLYYLILAMIMRYFLYALVPVFLLSLIFRQTRQFFDNWLGQIINFIIQAVLLVAFVSIMHELLFGIVDFMARSLAPNLCYMPWISIPAPSQLVGSDSWYHFYRFQFVDANTGLPWVKTVPSPSIDSLTDFLVGCIGTFFCMFMFMFVGFIQQMGTNLASAGVQVKSAALKGLAKAGGGALGSALGTSGRQGLGNLAKGDVVGALGGAATGFGKGGAGSLRGSIGKLLDDHKPK